MARLLPFVIAVGVLLSAYAYYVEYQAEQAKKMGTTYKALCDIGMFSCTKVFSSEFGSFSQFLGLPKVSNAIVGVAFFMLELVIEPYTSLLLLTSASSCVGSCVLFYVLTVKLNDFCIVCFSIYVVNFTTFFTALSRYRRIQAYKQRQAKGKAE